MDFSDTDFGSEPYILSRQISQDRLIKICKYRQGAKCCKYVFFPRGKLDYYCVKKIPTMKDFMDRESKIAKGDNCSGL